ncbi:MAG: ABC transporter ATP-binding protein [Pseudomonadota bacterium]
MTPREAPKSSILQAILRVIRENAFEQKWVYAVAICAMVVVAGSTAASAWIMQAIFDLLANDPLAYSAPVVASAVVVILTCKGLSGYIQQIALAKAGNRVVADIQRKIYRKLLQQEAAWFDSTESSDILVRVTQSAQAARSIIDIVVTSFVRDALTLAGLIAVMVWQYALLSGVFLILGPVAVLGVRAVLSSVRRIMRAEMISLTEILKVLQETSAGLRVVRAFGLEEILQARMDRAVRDVENRSNAIVRLESITVPMLDALSGLAIATIILVSASTFVPGAKPSSGELMAFVTALLMAFEPAKRLSQMRVELEAAFVGVKMMFDILDRPDAMQDGPECVDLPHQVGEVALRGVTFSYNGKRNALTNMTLIFPAGRTTALVGPSGGGKSTIMSLLLRLYDPKDGSVEIDGLNLQRVTRQSLQERTAYVGQNTFLFATTVRENIRMGRRSATDAEVEAAARAAQAHEFIMGLPDGYDAQVGENGIFLSGGQRQRLSLARAIVKDAAILLLDEATSALDNRAEWLVRDAIATATRGRTTILIAHRLSTILAADEVAYIDGGRVVEQGPLAEMLNGKGKVAALFDRAVVKLPAA